MAKKIDIMQSGLPSKMYYLAFQKPMSIYEMSKVIHGKVQPQKLYPWRDKLKEKGYIKEVERDKWQSTVTPILEEIEKRTQKTFSQKQKEVLSKFIDTIFRESISEVHQDMKENFNALDSIVSDFDLFLIRYYLFCLSLNHLWY